MSVFRGNWNPINKGPGNSLFIKDDGDLFCEDCYGEGIQKKQLKTSGVVGSKSPLFPLQTGEGKVRSLGSGTGEFFDVGDWITNGFAKDTDQYPATVGGGYTNIYDPLPTTVGVDKMDGDFVLTLPTPAEIAAGTFTSGMAYFDNGTSRVRWNNRKDRWELDVNDDPDNALSAKKLGNPFSPIGWYVSKVNGADRVYFGFQAVAGGWHI